MSDERSFSKSKLIKNYLRSSVLQERAVRSALISVERKVGKVRITMSQQRALLPRRLEKVGFIK